MPFQGRSLDDLPLAAYSTGMVDDEATEADATEVDPTEAAPERAHVPMDARAAALSIVEPRPSSSTPMEQSPDAQAASAPAASAPAASAPASGGQPGESRLPRLAGLPRLGVPRSWLSAPPRDARMAVRDPRVLAGGGIVIAVVVLAAVFGRGGMSGVSAPVHSATPAPAAVVRPPGTVTMTLSGGIKGTYTLTGSTGFGRPEGDHLASSWTDTLGSSLTLTGQASSGTRPTGPDLVLSWTMNVNGKTVTFTSSAGECVVGMAVQPSTVKGSIICGKLRSDDGKVVVKATGSYQT